MLQSHWLGFWGTENKKRWVLKWVNDWLIWGLQMLMYLQVLLRNSFFSFFYFWCLCFERKIWCTNESVWNLVRHLFSLGCFFLFWIINKVNCDREKLPKIILSFILLIFFSFYLFFVQFLKQFLSLNISKYAL